MSQNTLPKQNGIHIPFLIALIAAVIAIVMFFLPYVTTVGSYRDMLDGMGGEPVFKASDITARDLKELSLFEYAKMSYQAGEEIFKRESAGKGDAVLYSLVLGFSILVLVFVLARKPVLIFIFNALLGGMCYLMHWLFDDRGLFSGIQSKPSIAYYTLYICVAAIAVGAVWMFVEERKIKKAAKMVHA